jgi:radical SAM protein with 4Fe4S-binding SPASM domain
MNCLHCYNASSLASQIPVYSAEVLKTVADKVCPHIKDINFGTGEFLCNPNALELIRHIRASYPHVDMSVTTNGYTIVKMDPAEVKNMFNDVDVSIDFPDETRHNAFRVHSQAWEWAIRAMEILQHLRIQHTVVTCVTSQTTDADLLGLLDMASRYQSFMRINWYRQVGRGVADGLRITAARAWEIVDLLAPRVVFSSLDPVFAGPLGVKCQPCPAGVLSARIHQDGSVTAYPFLKGPEWTAGNILEPETTLETIHASAAFTRLRERPLPVACVTCPFANTCKGGCVTRAALHNGGINQVDDYCPKEAGLLPVVQNLAGKVRVEKQGNLVHDGYLCTTIMKPNKKETV